MHTSFPPFLREPESLAKEMVPFTIRRSSSFTKLTKKIPHKCAQWFVCHWFHVQSSPPRINHSNHVLLSEHACLSLTWSLHLSKSFSGTTFLTFVYFSEVNSTLSSKAMSRMSYPDLIFLAWTHKYVILIICISTLTPNCNSLGTSSSEFELTKDPKKMLSIKHTQYAEFKLLILILPSLK